MLFDGRELTPKTPSDLDRLEKGWRTGELGSGLPQYVSQIGLNNLRIVPAYAGHVYLCLRLKPSMDTTELPDFMGSEFAEVIGWGALSRVLTVPGQSYSNPDLAVFYAQKFSDKLDKLQLKGSTGQQNAPKRSRGRFF